MSLFSGRLAKIGSFLTRCRTIFSVSVAKLDQSVFFQPIRWKNY